MANLTALKLFTKFVTDCFIKVVKQDLNKMQLSTPRNLTTSLCCIPLLC